MYVLTYIINSLQFVGNNPNKGGSKNFFAPQID